MGVFFIWRTLANGSFIVAADGKGIYIRELFNGKNFILIYWEIVENIGIDFYDGKELIIKTKIPENSEIKNICNGRVRKDTNFLVIELPIGLGVDHEKMVLRFIELNKKLLVVNL